MPQSSPSWGTYLINLDRASNRLADMAARLGALGIAFERISAVDGTRITPDASEFSPLSYALMHGRRPIPAEIGCYLSHIACAKAFLASDQNFALILEDDVQFSADFTSAIEAAMALPDSWDILRLSTVNRGKKYPFKKVDETYSLAVALTREKGAGAYMINRKAAHWLVTKMLPMRISYDIAFDVEYLYGLKAAFLEPLPADQRTGYETQIQNNIPGYKYPKYRYLTVLPYRTYLELTRFFLRGYRLLHNRLRYR